jgi:hypothetical protein
MHPPLTAYFHLRVPWESEIEKLVPMIVVIDVLLFGKELTMH